MNGIKNCDKNNIMTREAFIRKWLGNEQKSYTEQFRDEMRDDLDKVIKYAQQRDEKVNLSNVIICSECGKPFQKKKIIVQGDIDTCDDCLCPE